MMMTRSNYLDKNDNDHVSTKRVEYILSYAGEIHFSDDL